MRGGFARGAKRPKEEVRASVSELSTHGVALRLREGDYALTGDQRDRLRRGLGRLGFALPCKLSPGAVLISGISPQDARWVEGMAGDVPLNREPCAAVAGTAADGMNAAHTLRFFSAAEARASERLVMRLRISQVSAALLALPLSAGAAVVLTYRCAQGPMRSVLGLHLCQAHDFSWLEWSLACVPLVVAFYHMVLDTLKERFLFRK